MKIKLSKSQWESVGKKAGWNKKAGAEDNESVGELENIAKVLINNPEYLLKSLISSPEGIKFLKHFNMNSDRLKSYMLVNKGVI